MTETPDTTPDTTYVPLQEYAAHQGATERTVRRWLADARVPGAFQDDRRRWWLPLDVAPVDVDVDAPRPGPAARPSTDMTRDAPPDTGGVVSVVAPLQVGPLGMLGTLQDAADALDTTVGGVRRLADAGHLVVGPFGPRGALRVYLPGGAKP